MGSARSGVLIRGSRVLFIPLLSVVRLTGFLLMVISPTPFRFTETTPRLVQAEEI